MAFAHATSPLCPVGSVAGRAPAPHSGRHRPAPETALLARGCPWAQGTRVALVASAPTSTSRGAVTVSAWTRRGGEDEGGRGRVRTWADNIKGILMRESTGGTTDDEVTQVTNDLMVAYRLLDGEVIGVDTKFCSKFLTRGDAKKLTIPASWLYPALGPSLISRYRYSNERLSELLPRMPGCQVVNMGCGFDTRPLERWDLDGKDVFEVDFPAVIDDKRGALERAGVEIPPTLRMVGADLNKATTLEMDGFTPAEKPTVLLMEGLLYYLEEEVQEKVLSPDFLGLQKGSKVMFDVLLQQHIRFFNSNISSPISRTPLWTDCYMARGEETMTKDTVREAVLALGYSSVKIEEMGDVVEKDWGPTDHRFTLIDKKFGFFPVAVKGGGPDSRDTWLLVEATV